MPLTCDSETIMVYEYTDPAEHFKGWLVIDGVKNSLCAGGMRVQPGLTRDHVIAMARNMTMKMRICGLPIDGAKCGIDYQPGAPGKRAAMARFMAAIRPYIEDRYSMGPDLNTSMDELESIARELGIPSVKMAIAKAQDMDITTFLRRYDILSHKALGDWSLGRLRAGFGVAAAALATLEALAIPANGARIAVQGFGNLAKAAIVTLAEAGTVITAIADAEKCAAASPDQALPIGELLKYTGTLLPSTANNMNLRFEPKEAVLTHDCDILVLAAVENVISQANADCIKAKAVIPGANLAVTLDGDVALYERRVIALPSFVAGCGGSLSMNGLFGPSQPPSPRQVLDYIGDAMASMVKKILSKSAADNITPTQAAQLICQTEPISGQKPYSCV